MSFLLIDLTKRVKATLRRKKELVGTHIDQIEVGHRNANVSASKKKSGKCNMLS